MKTTTNYWFLIESYVYINIANGSALLYNTLDGVALESSQIEIIDLLEEILLEENCGVILLKNEHLEQPVIFDFIKKLRENYMGDIIDVNLSKGKPIQILPYINYQNKRNKKYNFAFLESLLQVMFEVNIHLDNTSDIEKIKAYLQYVPDNSVFNVIGDMKNVDGAIDFVNFLKNRQNPKIISCLYTYIPDLCLDFNDDFLYKISVHFPIDKSKFRESIQLIERLNTPFGYIFDVTSLEEYQEANCLIADYQIEKYVFNPVYTGNNIQFFKENIYLTKDDILSVQISMKDLFSKRAINKNDFGKIHIMPNGDIYANVNHSVLGSIYTHSIYEIIQKEIEEGQSWLRVRNQAPCNNCVYQDLCPSPSDYEIVIGYPNLCHVKS